MLFNLNLYCIGGSSELEPARLWTDCKSLALWLVPPQWAWHAHHSNTAVLVTQLRCPSRWPQASLCCGPARRPTTQLSSTQYKNPLKPHLDLGWGLVLKSQEHVSLNVGKHQNGFLERYRSFQSQMIDCVVALSDTAFLNCKCETTKIGNAMQAIIWGLYPLEYSCEYSWMAWITRVQHMQCHLKWQ